MRSLGGFSKLCSGVGIRLVHSKPQFKQSAKLITPRRLAIGVSAICAAGGSLAYYYRHSDSLSLSFMPNNKPPYDGYLEEFPPPPRATQLEYIERAGALDFDPNLGSNSRYIDITSKEGKQMIKDEIIRFKEQNDHEVIRIPFFYDVYRGAAGLVFYDDVYKAARSCVTSIEEAFAISLYQSIKKDILSKYDYEGCWLGIHPIIVTDSKTGKSTVTGITTVVGNDENDVLRLLDSQGIGDQSFINCMNYERFCWTTSK